MFPYVQNSTFHLPTTYRVMPQTPNLCGGWSWHTVSMLSIKQNQYCLTVIFQQTSHNLLVQSVNTKWGQNNFRCFATAQYKSATWHVSYLQKYCTSSRLIIVFYMDCSSYLLKRFTLYCTKYYFTVRCIIACKHNYTLTWTLAEVLKCSSPWNMKLQMIYPVPGATTSAHH